MGVELRTALFTTLALALAACGESFSATDAGGGGSGGSGAAGGEAASSATTTADGGTGGVPAGGTGGAPCDTSDADGDGWSECDGDCDDAVAFVHPEAIEICGDGVDEDCDGKGDDEAPCNGLGTFVSQKNGNVGATGTMKDPVATIAEGLENAALIGAEGAPQIVLISAGSYVEDLVVTGPVSLAGGYDPDDWSQRDPKVFTTTIKNTKSEGLKLIGTEQPMIVEGLSIQGRNVAAGSGASAAVTIDGGDALLVDDVIAGGQVSVGAGASVGVRVVTETALGAQVALHGNMISSGASTGGGSYAVSVDSEMMEVELVSNEAVAGKGTESIGLLVASAAGVTAAGNVFQSRTATGASGVDSTSLGVWVKAAGALAFDANLVNPDQVFDPPRCFTPGVWCGGMRASVPSAVIVNNIVYGSASAASAALHLLEQPESLAGVVVSSNLFVGAGDTGPQSRSAAVLLGSPMPDPGVTMIGRFRNNIFLGGLSESNYGFWEQQVMGETVDPAALDHNLFYFPVAGQNGGVLYLDWNGLAAVPITMIDGLPGDGANLFENPILSDGQHLDPASPCRNKGTDLDAPVTDIDGDGRPQGEGFDIGPDEVVSN